jgi:hypothetical protein
MCYVVIDVSVEEKHKETYEELLQRVVLEVERSYKKWFVIYEQAKTKFEEGNKILEAIRGMCEGVKFSTDQIMELKGKTSYTIRLGIKAPGAANRRTEKEISKNLNKIPQVLFVKITDRIDKSQLVYTKEPLEDIPFIAVVEPRLR